MSKAIRVTVLALLTSTWNQIPNPNSVNSMQRRSSMLLLIVKIMTQYSFASAVFQKHTFYALKSCSTSSVLVLVILCVYFCAFILKAKFTKLWFLPPTLPVSRY